MSCSNFEQLIALYVEEDLSAVDHGRVEEHLRECSSCWDLAEDLKESQAVFKSIRQDVPDATVLSALYDRVLNEVRGLETMTWFERFVFGGLRRKAALAGIALVIAGSGALWLVRLERVASVAPTAVANNRAPALEVSPLVARSQAPPAVRRREPKRVQRLVPEPAPALPLEEPKQVAIKFVTDDPNIIIYWLVDEKGD